jgi:putative endonuclease
VGRLVWFEVFYDVRVAIQREKTLKRWLRAWKIALIERSNPSWCDLYDEIAA